MPLGEFLAILILGLCFLCCVGYISVAHFHHDCRTPRDIIPDAPWKTPARTEHLVEASFSAIYYRYQVQIAAGALYEYDVGKVTIENVYFASRHGRVGTIDLHVGAQISILGRQMRLMQVGGCVVRVFTFHALRGLDHSLD